MLSLIRVATIHLMSEVDNVDFIRNTWRTVIGKYRHMKERKSVTQYL